MTDLPHPLDFEWRTFGPYMKLWYDVKDPVTGVIYEHCWPNAGQIRVPGINDTATKERVFFEGQCEVRISATHPFSGSTQLTPDNIALLKKVYCE